MTFGDFHKNEFYENVDLCLGEDFGYNLLYDWFVSFYF